MTSRAPLLSATPFPPRGRARLHIGSMGTALAIVALTTRTAPSCIHLFRQRPRSTSPRTGAQRRRLGTSTSAIRDQRVALHAATRQARGQTARAMAVRRIDKTGGAAPRTMFSTLMRMASTRMRRAASAAAERCTQRVSRLWRRHRSRQRCRQQRCHSRRRRRCPRRRRAHQ